MRAVIIAALTKKTVIKKFGSKVFCGSCHLHLHFFLVIPGAT